VPVDALLTRPCTILRSTGAADDYDQTPGTPTQASTRCELQQLTSTEAGEAAIELTVWQAFFPAGTVLSGADAIQVDGETYELLGDAWPVRHPRTGRESHVQAQVRRSQ
jgi:hypothetical protein